MRLQHVRSKRSVDKDPVTSAVSEPYRCGIAAEITLPTILVPRRSLLDLTRRGNVDKRIILPTRLQNSGHIIKPSNDNLRIPVTLVHYRTVGKLVCLL